jgi:hypothetical protein
MPVCLFRLFVNMKLPIDRIATPLSVHKRFPATICCKASSATTADERYRQQDHHDLQPVGNSMRHKPMQITVVVTRPSVDPVEREPD